MAKKEKIVDLKPQTITKEELESLQKLIEGLNRTQLEIGSIETRKHTLLHQVTQLQNAMATMQKTFEETYGTVDINITDGAIAYPEDVEADKKD
jgi:hypothetical protein|tara:strand:- start:161 stop:442 length:282 start_codon:yes stop_codon:yes gene_type:complete